MFVLHMGVYIDIDKMMSIFVDICVINKVCVCVHQHTIMYIATIS